MGSDHLLPLVAIVIWAVVYDVNRRRRSDPLTGRDANASGVERGAIPMPLAVDSRRDLEFQRGLDQASDQVATGGMGRSEGQLV